MTTLSVFSCYIILLKVLILFKILTLFKNNNRPKFKATLVGNRCESNQMYQSINNKNVTFKREERHNKTDATENRKTIIYYSTLGTQSSHPDH